MQSPRTMRSDKALLAATFAAVSLALADAGCGNSSSGSSTAAGSEGGACYPNGTCNAGLTCSSGMCVTMAGSGAGSAGHACYPNGTCNAGLTCSAGTCILGEAGSASGAAASGAGGGSSGSASGATGSSSGSGAITSGSASGSSGSIDSGTGSPGGSASSGGSIDGGGDAGGADAGSIAPSCQAGGAGMTNCGASSESCCTSLEVTGGTFYRTYTNSGDGGTGEADPATVSSFRLDKYDVTVGRFRQFVAAWNNGSGWTPAAGSGKHIHLNGGKGLANGATPGTYETGWLTSDNSNIAPTDGNLGGYGATWTTSPGNGKGETEPMSYVNWYESYAFCIWDGGFLPSEAEWEYAAAGGSQQREYPWGSTDPGTMGQYAIYRSGQALAPVGQATLGAGLWGQLDLAGNVWQWNLDWSATYVDPCTDCAFLTGGPGGATARALRGGDAEGYSSAPADLTPSRVDSDGPNARGFDAFGYGFRCARSP